MSDKDDDVAVELRKINQSLGGLLASQKAHGFELAEIKARVKETNGRVTALEAANIAKQAVDRERARSNDLVSQHSSEVNTHRARRIDRSIGAAVAIFAVVIGAVLADVTWF